MKNARSITWLELIKNQFLKISSFLWMLVTTLDHSLKSNLKDFKPPSSLMISLL